MASHLVSQSRWEPTAAIAGARLAGVVGAAVTLAGIVLSGPLAVWLVARTHPQPPWGGAELFARSFHPLQVLPYAGGIVLVAGAVVLVVAAAALARGRQRILAGVARVFLAVFATMIFLNYVAQTAFVPALARGFRAADAPVLAAVSMANPISFAWALEMWGWAFLGVATALVAPAFPALRAGALARATSLAFAANGAVSVLGAVISAIAPGWMMTARGLALFALWNVLFFVMAALALAVFHTGRAHTKGIHTGRIP